MGMRFSIVGAFLLACQTVALAGTVTVKAIEIRGSRYFTRAELLEGAGITAAKNGGITVNVDALKNTLAKVRFLKKYEVITGNNILRINVEERVPEHVVVLKKGSELVPLELDASGMIISVNRLHISERPVLIISDKDIVRGMVTKDIRELFSLLNSVKARCTRLYNEMTDIELEQDGFLVIHFKGRRTHYRIAPSIAQCIRLQYIVGYLDNKNRDPEGVHLYNEMALCTQ